MQDLWGPKPLRPHPRPVEVSSNWTGPLALWEGDGDVGGGGPPFGAESQLTPSIEVRRMTVNIKMLAVNERQTAESKKELRGLERGRTRSPGICLLVSNAFLITLR